VIEDVRDRIERTVLEGVGRAASRYQENTSIPVDLLESDEEYLAVFDAPGVPADDVDVRFDENVVRVRVDRFRTLHEGFDLRAPGRGMSLGGEVELPSEVSVDPKTASAVLATNGTIQVHVPKVEDEPVTIDAEDGDQPQESDGGVDPTVTS